MPPLSRSRSLRQPGFTHRGSNEDASGAVDDAKLDSSLSMTGEGLSNHERSCSGDAVRIPIHDRVATTLDESAISDRLSGSSQGKKARALGRRGDFQTGRASDVQYLPLVGASPNSSRLPLPSQLSRSSSIRQPKDIGSRRDTMKPIHTESTPTAKITPATGKPPSDLTECGPHEEKLRLDDVCPVPSGVSDAATTKSAAAGHSRVRSGYGPHISLFQTTHPKAKKNLNPVSRPNFITYQRQFSPKKQKPPSAPADPCPSRSSTSTDVNQYTDLQDELLQLQWIYHSSDKQLQNWLQNGKEIMGTRRGQQMLEVSQVNELERNQQISINGAALRQWLALSKGDKSFEKVESLAQCVRTLTDLIRPNGEVSQATEQFETWYGDTTEVLRVRSETGCGDYPKFIQPLGKSWVEAVSKLIHSVRSCLGRFEKLGSVEGSSGLGLVLNAHLRLAKGLLDELEVMETIHSAVLDQEEDWIRCRTAIILSSDKGDEAPAAELKGRAAWDRPA